MKKAHSLLLMLSLAGSFLQLHAQDTLLAREKFALYKTVKLTSDLSGLMPHQQMMLREMILAAQQADDIYWKQAFNSDRNKFLDGIKDSVIRNYAMLNYGPWDRLNNDQPFVKGYKAKPKGAGFYPADMTVKEFEEWKNDNKRNPYTVVRRGKDKKLTLVPYSEAYREQIEQMCVHLQNLLPMPPDEIERPFLEYLAMRIQALRTNDYDASDRAWLNNKASKFDLIIGPIENYEDQLFGIRNSFEAYVLVRDSAWSAKLDRYVALLPELQKSLPVKDEFKKELPGNASQLAVFDAVYYAGDCNAGGKTIAVNLPNSEEIQVSMGTRRSQLKNVMKAKFDHILLPISASMIVPEQQGLISFDAFFNDVMFHEVAHGLGVKEVAATGAPVKDALGADYAAIEECKADILGLYMVTYLAERGQLDGPSLESHYVTFAASVFRSVRFGASSAHGKANMITFNTLLNSGAVVRDNNGRYRVDVKKMKEAVSALVTTVIGLQGTGDAKGTADLLAKKAVIGADLAADLSRLEKAGIPVDVVFEQGLKTLGLE